MMTTAPTAEPTETTDQSAEEALERARATVAMMEADLARLPQDYTLAAKRADAAAMREIRHRKVDVEEGLHAARVRAVRAELAQLTRAAGALHGREPGIAEAIATAGANLVAARLHFDEAARARDVAENTAATLRWEQQDARARILAAQDKLAALVATPMPN